MTTRIDMMADKKLIARLRAIARHGITVVGVSLANGMKRMMMMMRALMTVKNFALHRTVSALQGMPPVGFARPYIVMRTTKDVMIDEKVFNASNGLLAAQAPTRDGRDGRITRLTHDTIRPLVSSIVTTVSLVGSAINLCDVLGDVLLGSLRLRAG